MPLEQTLDQLAHTSSCAFFFLPVDGTIFLQEVSQFLGKSNQFLVLVKILDGLGFGEGIVKG